MSFLLFLFSPLFFFFLFLRYDNLSKYKLPYPTAIFELRFFLENPEPFYLLAQEMFPGQWRPTPGHYFIKLLAEKGVLQRHWTQVNLFVCLFLFSSFFRFSEY